MSRSLALTLLLSSLLTGCQFTTGSPRMTIPVTLNKQSKLLLSSNLGPLVLDTGAAVALVDETFARRYKLKKTNDTATVKDVTGATVQATMAVIPKLSIPAKEPGRQWELHDIDVVVIPRMHNLQHIGSSFILGMPAFENRIVEVDLPKSEIRLLRHLPFGINCQSFPLKVAESGGGGTPGIRIKFRGIDPIYGVLDTGHSEYLSLSGEAWPRIPIHEGSKRQGRGGGFLADMSHEKATAAPNVTVGNVTVVNAPISESKGSEWRHTLIGVSILKHTTFAIDWNRRKAVFRTPWTFLNHIYITHNAPKKSPGS